MSRLAPQERVLGPLFARFGTSMRLNYPLGRSGATRGNSGFRDNMFGGSERADRFAQRVLAERE